MKFRSGAAFIILVLVEAVLAFNCGQSSQSAPTAPVEPSNIFISISPGKSAVSTGSTEQFTASVTGTTKTAVTWSILSSGTNEGSVDSTGSYKAPDLGLPNSVTIEAKSVANPSITATAIV